jgi:23S rRNA (uracil1939-C5)-methyltransferase
VGRSRDLPLLGKVRITDVAAEGNAIARVDNLVVFVPMVIPGDVVDIQITKKRKRYLEGRAVKFHEYSSDRIEPRCEHFGVCGGCKWQHLPYSLQLQYKEKQVSDNLRRIGRISLQNLLPVLGSKDEYLYRNKLEYTFSNRRWHTREEIESGEKLMSEDVLGFHIPGLFDKVLDIGWCHLQPEPSNRIRNAVKQYALDNRLEFFDLREQKGFLRNLIIRNSLSGKVMVIVVFFREDKKRREALLDFLADRFPEITSLMYVVNRKKNDSLGDQIPVLYRGEDHITEEMEDLVFRIGPKSFYQTNTRQALELYSTTLKFAELRGNETVYDLYTGTGTIANFVARSAGKVIGIEYIEEAVADARINSEMNNIRNTIFISGDIKDIFTGEFIRSNGRPDVVITDPPRAGMHKDVVRSIIDATPDRIVYSSCNVATQARDILLLSGQYEVSAIQPVDMFPHTHHIENVVLLRLKSNETL